MSLRLKTFVMLVMGNGKRIGLGLVGCNRKIDYTTDEWVCLNILDHPI